MDVPSAELKQLWYGMIFTMGYEMAYYSCQTNGGWLMARDKMPQLTAQMKRCALTQSAWARRKQVKNIMRERSASGRDKWNI